MNKDLQKFIGSQKLLTISNIDSDKSPWIFNVYFGNDNELNLYFVSSDNTKHSVDIKDNPNVAFSTVWYDKHNLSDRKAIQGTGVCKKITNWISVGKSLYHLHKKLDFLKDIVTVENMKSKAIESRLYTIRPNYIKFWNDELYGIEGVEEFYF